MNERLILMAPNSSLQLQLESAEMRVIVWPAPVVQSIENPATLDEAIESLYGYDWIVFVNPDAARFFLERLKRQARDVSDLDSIRICAIGEATAQALEEAQVHLDVVAMRANSNAVLEQLTSYAGDLHRLNFLLPQAAIGRDYLKLKIEETGARIDLVPTYETVAREDATRLAALHSMLMTGSVDAVLFLSAREVHDFSRLFDTNDLDSILKHPVVLTGSSGATRAAVDSGLSRPVEMPGVDANAVIDIVARC